MGCDITGRYRGTLGKPAGSDGQATGWRGRPGCRQLFFQARRAAEAMSLQNSMASELSVVSGPVQRSIRYESALTAQKTTYCGCMLFHAKVH